MNRRQKKRSGEVDRSVGCNKPPGRGRKCGRAPEPQELAPTTPKSKDDAVQPVNGEDVSGAAAPPGVTEDRRKNPSDFAILMARS